MSDPTDNLLNLLDEQIRRVDIQIARWEHAQEHRNQHVEKMRRDIVLPKQAFLAKAIAALEEAKKLVKQAEQEKDEAVAEFEALKDARWETDNATALANLSRLRKEREDHLKELNKVFQRAYFPVTKEAAIAGGFQLIEGAKLPSKKGGSK